MGFFDRINPSVSIRSIREKIGLDLEDRDGFLAVWDLVAEFCIDRSENGVPFTEGEAGMVASQVARAALYGEDVAVSPDGKPRLSESMRKRFEDVARAAKLPDGCEAETLSRIFAAAVEKSGALARLRKPD